MPLILLRVDDRLIHGQVVEGWVRTLSINHLIVASDALVHDEVQQALFALAVPEGIRVTGQSLKDAAEFLSGKISESDRILALVASPVEALALIQFGLKIPTINVGGVHFRPGKVQLLKSLSVDDTDIQALQSLLRLGVQLEGRALPMDDPDNIEAVLSSYAGVKR